MRSSLAALVLTPVLLGLSAPVAAAQEEPVPGQVDFAVTASFDKAEYGSGDDIGISITVSNAGEVPIDQVYVSADSADLALWDTTWGELQHPGTALAPGAAITVSATARLYNVVELLRVDINVGTGMDQWDPEDENVDFVLEAPVHQAYGNLGGLAYGDRNGNGQFDAGEEFRGTEVQISGGVPWGEHVARTDSAGRFLASDLPAGFYSVSGPFGDDWLFENIDEVRVDEGATADVVLAARRVGQPVLSASLEFDRDRYAVGDTIRIRITLTNPSDADVAGVVGWCGRAGNDHELRSDNRGDFASDGPGVLVPANSTQVFDVTDTVPLASLNSGYVSASCGFIVGHDYHNSAEAADIADVPGGFSDFAGRVLQIRADGSQVPVARVQLMLVHRSGRVAARTRSNAGGAYKFVQAPNNTYLMRVAGPWKLVEPEKLYYVVESGAWSPEDVLIVRGPAEPGTGSGPGAGPGSPGPAPAATVTPAATQSLADTGADVGTPFLAGLLLLVTGATLRFARSKRLVE